MARWCLVGDLNYSKSWISTSYRLSVVTPLGYKPVLCRPPLGFGYRPGSSVNEGHYGLRIIKPLVDRWCYNGIIFMQQTALLYRCVSNHTSISFSLSYNSSPSFVTSMLSLFSKSLSKDCEFLSACTHASKRSLCGVNDFDGFSAASSFLKRL